MQLAILRFAHTITFESKTPGHFSANFLISSSTLLVSRFFPLILPLHHRPAPGPLIILHTPRSSRAPCPTNELKTTSSPCHASPVGQEQI